MEKFKYGVGPFGLIAFGIALAIGLAACEKLADVGKDETVVNASLVCKGYTAKDVCEADTRCMWVDKSAKPDGVSHCKDK